MKKTQCHKRAKFPTINLFPQAFQEGGYLKTELLLLHLEPRVRLIDKDVYFAIQVLSGCLFEPGIK